MKHRLNELERRFSKMIPPQIKRPSGYNGILCRDEAKLRVYKAGLEQLKKLIVYCEKLILQIARLRGKINE